MFPSYFMFKPMTVIQSLNHNLAAQGSPTLAMKSHHADFNGHNNSLDFNDHRGYYVGQYTWAGRNVFYRGTDFSEALVVSKREFNQQGAGAQLWVYPHTEADNEILKKDPDFQVTHDVMEASRVVHESWYTWKHAEAGFCVGYMGHFDSFRWSVLEPCETQEEFNSQWEKLSQERPGDKPNETP